MPTIEAGMSPQTNVRLLWEEKGVPQTLQTLFTFIQFLLTELRKKN
jgi:hypothetical protein